MRVHERLFEVVRRHFECERCAALFVLGLAVVGWAVGAIWFD